MNEEQVRTFVDKVKSCGLSDEERELLDAIFVVVAEIHEENTPAYADEFAGAFTKKQADLVLEYIAASTANHAHPVTIGHFPSAHVCDIIKRKHDG